MRTEGGHLEQRRARRLLSSHSNATSSRHSFIHSLPSPSFFLSFLSSSLSFPSGLSLPFPVLPFPPAFPFVRFSFILPISPLPRLSLLPAPLFFKFPNTRITFDSCCLILCFDLQFKSRSMRLAFAHKCRRSGNGGV